LTFDLFLAQIAFFVQNWHCLFNQYSNGVEDSYSRIDYILLSPAMKRDWVASGTYIPTIPNWGVGSDHRPVVVARQARKWLLK
jgi:exonuclease III